MNNKNSQYKIKRLEKYNRKFNHFTNNFNKIMKWSNNFDVKLLLNDEIKKYAIYKLYQECIESIFDIISMIIKDLNLEIHDDYSNLEQLKLNNLLNDKEIKILRKGNHIRNLIVHWYNKIEEIKILKDIKSIIHNLKDIINRFKKWIDGLF